MANKKLIIETQVNTEGLDKAAQKVGELKKLSGGVSIQYNIDGKPLDVVIDKSLNLKRQVVELTKALRTVKEGTDEFRLLSTTLGDTQDQLAQSNAKSRDLLASFQLIPGPIGDFASKLNGAIGLLKTFSSFSLKDIRFQFKETINDIVDIINGFYGVEEATKSSKTSIQNKTAALDDDTTAQQENTSATDDGTAATNAGTAANLKQTTAIEEQTKAKKSSLSVSEKRLEAQRALNDATKSEIEFLSQEKNAKQAINDVMKAGNVTMGQATAAFEQLLRDKEKEYELGLQRERQLERNVAAEKNAIEARTKQGQTIANLNEKQKEQFKIINQIRDADQRQAETLKFLTEVEKENTAATQTNTVAKESNTAVTTLYTKATQLATFATKAFDIALKSIGIGIVIGLVAKFAEKVFDAGKALFEASQESKDFEQTLKKNIETQQNARSAVDEVRIGFELAEKGVISKKKALDIYNEKLGGTIGQAENYNEAEKLFNDNTAAYIESVSLRAQAQEFFAIAAQRAAKAATQEDVEPTFWQNVGNALLSGGNAARQIGLTLETTAKNAGEFLTQSNDLRDKGNKLLEKALELEKKFKPKEDKKGAKQKEVDDTEKANALLLKLEQENAVAILETERKKQDKQLEIDRINEIAEVNKLKLSKDKENIRSAILLEIQEKYKQKVIALNKSRQAEDNKIFEEDQKKLKDYQNKIFEIINSGDQNEVNRAKAARARKFEDDKAALQADTNFQKETLENKIRILLALEKAFRQDVQKLDDDDAAKKREANLKKLDDELKFLQIRGEAVRRGTIAYFNNLRDISKKSEQRELKDLEDKAIKEKLTTEQVEAEKTAIKQKYANERKQIDQQELEAYLQFAQQILGAVSNVFSQIGQVNALEQQVAQENLTKSYIEANNQAKATITNQEELEKKLAENKKKFAKDEDSLKKAAFEQNKKIQIAQAVIGTLQGAVQAFTSLAGIPVVGPALGAAAAAAALVFGYKQVNLIKKTSYQSSLDLAESETIPTAGVGNRQLNYGRNYARGGMIGGRRHAEGGTIIEAEKGEAIMTRGAVAQFGPLLSLMNQAGGGTTFNSNLLTTRQDAPVVRVPAQQEQTPVFKTYVVSQELTTEAQRQARLKNLSVI